jgi:hypothetical protein
MRLVNLHGAGADTKGRGNFLGVKPPCRVFHHLPLARSQPSNALDVTPTHAPRRERTANRS